MCGGREETYYEITHIKSMLFYLLYRVGGQTARM
jgi:hypothetical protein